MAGAELGSPVVRLDWAGREEAIRLAGASPRAKLRKAPELSTGEGRSGNADIHAVMAEWYDRPSGPRAEHLRRGCRRFVLIEADDRAGTCVPRCLAEAPGVLCDYDFYTPALHHRVGLILPNLASARFARHGSKGRGPQEAVCFGSSSEREKGRRPWTSIRK
jgi:hypothetical protein